MTSIAGGRVDLGTLAPPQLRADAPTLLGLVEQDAALHESLVRNAHEQLGAPGARPAPPWGEAARQQQDHLGIQAANLVPEVVPPPTLVRNRHAITVPLGTQVALPGAGPGDDPWTVVGAGRSDRIELAKRTPDGTVQHQARRWTELVLANPSLAERHLVPGTDNGFPTGLRPADPAASSADDAWELFSTDARQGFVALDTGSWRELAGRHGITRLRPIPALPADGTNASALVGTASDPRRYVLAAEAEHVLGTDLLVGADELAPGHRATADVLELERIGRFFDRLGLRTWDDHGDDLVVMSGRTESIGNAAAHGNAEYAVVMTGPRDARVAASLMQHVPHEQRAAMRASEQVLRAHWRGVLAHEVGHVATQQAWTLDVAVAQNAAQEAGDLARFARFAEHGIVEEAFSDLFGTAYLRSRDLGVRDLGRLHNGIGDLDQLRATIAKLGFDHSGHTGTQLVTRPMLELQRRHGWDAVAEVTASATHRLGAAIGRGELQSIGVEDAARALRDAAATRFGLEDDGVRAMAAAWSKLRVVL